MSKSCIKNILVVRLDWIGDMVLFTPFLRELRANYPQAHITLVMNKRGENLFQACPYVDHLFCLSVGSASKSFLFDLIDVFGLSYKLRKTNYFELVFLPASSGGRLSILAKVLGILSNSNDTISYKEGKKFIGPLLDSFLTETYLPDNEQHEVLSNLALLKKKSLEIASNELELWTTPEDDTKAKILLGDHRAECKRIAIAPGAGSKLKEWSPQKFVELLKQISSTNEIETFILGGPSEISLGKLIAERVNAIDLTGKTTLRECAAIMRQMDLCIANDSSLMHIAAAVKTPVIALFGASCAERFSPWGTNNIVLWSKLDCSPCIRLNHSPTCWRCIYDSPICMEKIEVSNVLKLVQNNLDAQEDTRKTEILKIGAL